MGLGGVLGRGSLAARVILDYNPERSAYIITVPRTEAATDVRALMHEYGLSFSVPASTAAQAVLFTRNPYAAASFWQSATPAARAKLDWIIREVEASWAPESGRHITVPEDCELMPFQRASASYLLDRDHGLDGDEMGLGKTCTAIAVANEMQAQRCLVVCPAQVRFQWVRRIREWSTLSNPFIYAVVSSKYGTSTEAEWTVISYELARKPAILRGLVRQKFDLLICDEAHYLKSGATGRTRSIFGFHDGRADDGESDTAVAECLAARSKRVLCLTGTPTPNRPAEAYVMARGLNFDSIDWLSKQSFERRFNPIEKKKTKDGRVWVDEHRGRLPELGNRLRAHIMTRHLKRDVGGQLKNYLGDVIYDLVHIEETTAIRAALQAEALLDIDYETFQGKDKKFDGQVSAVRRQMGVAMAPQVAQYVSMLLDGGEQKIVVFAWHHEVLDILQAKLGHFGLLRVDGNVSAARKDNTTLEFVTGSARVLIGNLVSLGTGTDGLQDVCCHAVLAEPDWVPANNLQPIGRLDRIGQQFQVLADLCVAPNSISEKILATALKKNQINNKVLDRLPSAGV